MFIELETIREREVAHYLKNNHDLRFFPLCTKTISPGVNDFNNVDDKVNFLSKGVLELAETLQ